MTKHQPPPLKTTSMQTEMQNKDYFQHQPYHNCKLQISTTLLKKLSTGHQFIHKCCVKPEGLSRVKVEVLTDYSISEDTLGF